MQERENSILRTIRLHSKVKANLDYITNLYRRKTTIKVPFS